MFLPSVTDALVTEQQRCSWVFNNPLYMFALKIDDPENSHRCWAIMLSISCCQLTKLVCSWLTSRQCDGQAGSHWRPKDISCFLDQAKQTASKMHWKMESEHCKLHQQWVLMLWTSSCATIHGSWTGIVDPECPNYHLPLPHLDPTNSPHPQHPNPRKKQVRTNSEYGSRNVLTLIMPEKSELMLDMTVPYA